MTKLDYPHLFIKETPAYYDYTNPSGGGSGFFTPDRVDRISHAQMIVNQLEIAWQEAKKEAKERKSVSAPALTGTYIEFKSGLGFDLKFESLEARQYGIRLLNVRTLSDLDSEEKTQYCTIFVPFGKENILMNKAQKYIDSIRDTESEKPKNRDLVESIESLRKAVVHSFWYDPVEQIPENDNKFWCEVWLRVKPENSSSVIKNFTDICSILDIEIQNSRISFPEREVVLIFASTDDLDQILLSSDYIAEFRNAKSESDFFVGQENSIQSEWVEGLYERIKVSKEPKCFACVLDTGVNNQHPLLTKVLRDESCYTVNPNWTTSDFIGHGTSMCGTVAFGTNLGNMLQSNDEYELPFQLESCKLIPESSYFSDKNLFGARTSQAISRVEIENPNHRRVFCLTTTAGDDVDRGRPSSWSGSIDQLSAGVGTETRRLIILAAGNVGEPEDWNNYPEANLAKSIHDPAQAWNAVTVGALTFKDVIENSHFKLMYKPKARSGGLSPFSTTSKTWDKRWPNKPDIVCEGGNVGVDKTGFTTELDDLSLLSLSHKPEETLLISYCMTSAATGVATEIASRLMAQYPEAWPETIRALLIHSAQWTKELKAQFSLSGKTDKASYENLLRICGYGVPNVNQALQSARNNLTLVIQNEIQPFKVYGKSDVRAKEMQIYELPWPKEALALLPDNIDVTVNVTFE